MKAQSIKPRRDKGGATPCATSHDGDMRCDRKPSRINRLTLEGSNPRMAVLSHSRVSFPIPERNRSVSSQKRSGARRLAQASSGHAVIKVDIVNNVAERTGVSKVKAEEAVEALFDSMKEALKRGERIELRGFGVFVVKPRKRGVGRNPRTGEVTDIPPGKTIRFKPGKELQA